MKKKKEDFLFIFIFWSIFGTGTSSEKGQCSKCGRNFEIKIVGIQFHINKKVIKRIRLSLFVDSKRIPSHYSVFSPFVEY